MCALHVNLRTLALGPRVHLQMFVSVELLSALFYLTHRSLHHKSLYARFHKQHHEYTGTIGFAAEYAHPFETVYRWVTLSIT